MKPAEGRKRVVLEAVQPQVDCGRYAVRRFLGDRVTVSAAVFGDGHDHVAGRLLYRSEEEGGWRVAPLVAEGNDMWSAGFTVDKLGVWGYAVEGWVDHLGTWRADLIKRLEAQTGCEAQPAAAAAQTSAADRQFCDPSEPGDRIAQSNSFGADPIRVSADIPLALRTGVRLLRDVARRATGADAIALESAARSLEELLEQSATGDDRNAVADGARGYDTAKDVVSAEICELANRYPDLSLATRSDDFHLWVDRERARFSTWYELFPRSASTEAGRHGTFAAVEERLTAIAAMGFDVLYLPPVSPIGEAFRKGPNNNVVAQPGDVGSPWAVGSSEGGHTAIHRALGTLAEFEHLVAAARGHGMEIALDIAFQCSPDHPWVREHPSWFTIRPDGSIQYAENPPKKYQDIYPLNFESPDWSELWENLYEVFAYWIGHGVHIFRVDNPHTKALPFWEWCLGEIHRHHPEVIFLAEAFTRPHVMYALAKAGFTQSYTYFTWRTEKAEIQQYFEEITQPPVSDFFTPNLWPNTPDILHASLQTGGRPAFMQRLILAATLGANYGIYGPAFELGENMPMRPGSEEYLNSEKYEVRHWDLRAAHSIAPLISRVNRIRRENIALQSDRSLRFHAVDNPQVLCYSKRVPNGARDNTILVAINLDPHNEQAGWIDLDLKVLGIEHDESFDVEDLLTGAHYRWHDRSNYVALRPDVMPAHIFRVTRGT
ncbi:MAG TPA: alpha-1,4-glucan--maltose-1-phosphate maltosyltransferase [Granulicella sp.]|jgi:starch synthase (maltosyl-transferring)|nr:alpha-1,4-glucan--maltose-1-phosphate maltosyltransferase [Granulicella sp.]